MERNQVNVSLFLLAVTFDDIQLGHTYLFFLLLGGDHLKKDRGGGMGNAKREAQGSTVLQEAFRRSSKRKSLIDPLDTMTAIKNLQVCNLRNGLVIPNDMGIVEKELNKLQFMKDEPNIKIRLDSFLGYARRFGCDTVNCTTADGTSYLVVMLPDGTTQADVSNMIMHHHGAGKHLVLCPAPCNKVCSHKKKTCNEHAVVVSSIDDNCVEDVIISYSHIND